MKTIILLSVVVFSMLILPSYSQEKKLIHKAEVATGKLEFEEALDDYDMVLKDDGKSYKANMGKGMVLANNLDRFEEAIPYLQKAEKDMPKEKAELNVYNTLGKCYQFTCNFPMALKYFNKVHSYGKEGNPEYDIFLERRIASCKYAMEHTDVAPESEQSIRNIGKPVNSSFPEYAPVVIGDDLFFTSERKVDPKEKRNGWNGKYFEHIYKSSIVNGTYSEPELYTFPDRQDKEKYMLKHNESVISTSADGSKLYIFRDGKIFETDASDDFKEVSKLDRKVNRAKYQNHASLSVEGNQLFFSGVSNDGGGTDIFVTKKDGDGKWSDPEALDVTVNTFFDEDSPYYSSDGTLYFSSNGLAGYGGFDVYKTHLENGHWTTPENLGQPINSPGDDIYLTFENNSTEGYYASERLGGFGEMDIYQVHYSPAVKNENAVTAPVLAPVVVQEPPFVEPKVEAPPLVQPVTPEIPYEPAIQKPEELIPQKIAWNPPASYFDFDKYNLPDDAKAVLDSNIVELKKNPKLTIVVNGYCDSRGSEMYNKVLSDKRANAVKNYLISHGIAARRIVGVVGYGKTHLVNGCTEDVVCTEEEHQLNRRVELKPKERGTEIKRPYLGVNDKK